MGLTISYKVRLSRRATIAEFLAEARREGKARKWKITRGKSDTRLELSPHGKCDPLVFDFTRSLTCEEFVKTSSAPLRTHVQIVEFLRSLQPLCKSLSVEDECEYWETGDRAVLKKHREGFDNAFGKGRLAREPVPVTFTLNAYTVKSGPGGKAIVVPGERRGMKVK